MSYQIYDQLTLILQAKGREEYLIKRVELFPHSFKNNFMINKQIDYFCLGTNSNKDMMCDYFVNDQKVECKFVANGTCNLEKGLSQLALLREKEYLLKQKNKSKIN